MAAIPQLSIPPLCATFSRLAEEVWDVLGRASRAGIRYGEETVTDGLLLKLFEAHPYQTVIVQFNKRQEGKTGADWEWWLTDGSQWLGLLVQAKIVDVPEQQYAAILRRVGRSKKLQADVLIANARARGLYPLYCFYNYSPATPPRIRWNCRSYPQRDQWFGCSIADAVAVRSMAQAKRVSLPDMSQISFPWMCLVCCAAFTSSGRSLPSRAAGLVDGLLRRILPRIDESEEAGPKLLDEPPEYIRRLISREGDGRDGAAEEIGAENPNLRGIMILKDDRPGYERG